MATIKIIADKGECFEEIQEELVKAISAKDDIALDNKQYDDPLMNQLVDINDQIFFDAYKDLVREIIDILKQ